jgi:phosphoenolpyruvate-protein kinase (PTS system EI component)
MVIGTGRQVLEVADGVTVIVDGDTGRVVVDPEEAAVAAVEAAVAERGRVAERAAASRDLPTVTRDGHAVRVLANIAGIAELTMALHAGADGVGLLRTELGFLDAVGWPSLADHRRFLDPLLARLAGRTATVRVLDFGGDKTPPFLEGVGARGIALLRSAPDALEAQLEAILRAGSAAELRLLIPMVVERDDVLWVRDILDSIMARTPELSRPQLGAMIEVPAAVSMVRSIAAEVDVLSIGTNDLAHFHLGSDRAGARAPAHHPAVLRLVDEITSAARDAGVVVEVCGEAASDPIAMPLLVGLGVDELSVGAARVGEVRWRVRELEHAVARDAARRALQAESVAEVEAIVASL